MTTHPAPVEVHPDPRTLADAEYWNRLHDREREVGIMLALGLQHKEIAARLHLSESTIGWHQVSVYRALGVHNAMDLARAVLRVGALDVNAWLEGAGR